MSPAELIAAEVAAGHGLTLQDLRTDTRRKPVAIARQEAMHRLRHIQRDDGTHRYSLMWIARLFGKEDHTTVIHACKAVERRLCRGKD